MGRRLSVDTAKPRHRQWRQRSDHMFEAWCLLQSIELGTWCEAGLNREVIDGQIAGYWKRLRCGCVFVCEVQP